MKNLKVSVKLGLVIVQVLIMVIVASSMAVNDMNAFAKVVETAKNAK